MNDPVRTNDDVAELAELVHALADRLEAVSSEDVGALEEIRRRASRLSDPDRGPVRLRTVSTDSLTVTEPDGSMRMVLTGRGTFPTSIQIAGQIIEHPRDTAGMLFFNDEGDECGGLIFDGADGYQGGSLTFDQYQGDQVIQLWHEDSEAGRTAAIVVNDQPDAPLPEVMERYRALDSLPQDERAAAYECLRDEGYAMAQRMMAGKARDGSARVTLSAADGTPRILIAVQADGTPSIRVLDAEGIVIWQAP